MHCFTHRSCLSGSFPHLSTSWCAHSPFSPSWWWYPSLRTKKQHNASMFQLSPVSADAIHYTCSTKNVKWHNLHILPVTQMGLPIKYSYDQQARSHLKRTSLKAHTNNPVSKKNSSSFLRLPVLLPDPFRMLAFLRTTQTPLAVTTGTWIGKNIVSEVWRSDCAPKLNIPTASCASRCHTTNEAHWGSTNQSSAATVSVQQWQQL